MDELNASHGFVAGLTGLVSGVIGWFSMRDKCDKETCNATHKSVDASINRLEGKLDKVIDMLICQNNKGA